MKFRKKPVVIDAWQFDGTWQSAKLLLAMSESIGFGHPAQDPDHGEIEIKTLEGIMTASAGDWIIRGVKGELYPIKDEIFRQTYEAV